MRTAVVVKQVPTFTELALDADGRLIRAGLPLELNPYCRRAISQAVALAAGAEAGSTGAGAGSSVTVVTLGPPSAEDTLREAIAWGLEREVETDGLLVSDPAFAGSDTLATARALAAALRLAGPFDLILAGRNSVDSETGQVPPELAELLDLPYLTGVRTLRLDGRTVHARCEHDDGWVEAQVDLPAVLSCAERLIEPCKVDPAGRAAVPAGRIRRLAAADARLGAWGADEVVVLVPDPPIATAATAAEDVAAALAEWAGAAGPWAVLAPSTAWGREVAGRAAARLGAGLTGDAVGFDVDD